MHIKSIYSLKIPLFVNQVAEENKTSFSSKKGEEKVENSLKMLVENYKTGNKEAMNQIIIKMTPLVNKYARRLFKMEFEDMRQEMIIAIFEAVIKMEGEYSEYQCLRYITNAVKFRYMELSRKSYMLEINEEIVDYETLGQFEEHRTNSYSDIEFLYDLETKCDTSSAIKRKIYHYVVDYNLSDQEIAKNLNVSRQYINRCKKQIFHNVLKEN